MVHGQPRKRTGALPSSASPRLRSDPVGVPRDASRKTWAMEGSETPVVVGVLPAHAVQDPWERVRDSPAAPPRARREPAIETFSAIRLHPNTGVGVGGAVVGSPLPAPVPTARVRGVGKSPVLGEKLFCTGTTQRLRRPLSDRLDPRNARGHMAD